MACRDTWRWSYTVFFPVWFRHPAARSSSLSYGWDWVPLEDSSRVLSFAEPLRCRTPPLPPMPPPSARSPHSHLSPPPSERLEFWRVGVPWGRPFFSSGKGSVEEDRKVTLHVNMLRVCDSGLEIYVNLKINSIFFNILFTSQVFKWQLPFSLGLVHCRWWPLKGILSKTRKQYCLNRKTTTSLGFHVTQNSS